MCPTQANRFKDSGSTERKPEKVVKLPRWRPMRIVICTLQRERTRMKSFWTILRRFCDHTRFHFKGYCLLKAIWYKATFCNKICFSHIIYFCTLENSFSLLQISSPLDLGAMLYNPFRWWVSVQSKYNLSTYFHQKKAVDFLLVFHFPRKIPLS